MTESSKHPYDEKAVAYREAEKQFNNFRDGARALIRESIKKIARALPLESAHSFLVEVTSPQTVQAWFGIRPTGRKTLKGTYDVEKGATLVYSFGPDGRVAAILYPAESETYKARESWIILQVHRASERKLRRSVPGHLRALVAYCYVTSIDGKPTVREKMRIGWLSLTRRMQIDGKQVIRGGALLGWFFTFLGRAGLIAALHPVVTVLAIALLTWLGYQAIAGWLSR